MRPLPGEKRNAESEWDKSGMRKAESGNADDWSFRPQPCRGREDWRVNGGRCRIVSACIERRCLVNERRETAGDPWFIKTPASLRRLWARGKDCGQTEKPDATRNNSFADSDEILIPQVPSACYVDDSGFPLSAFGPCGAGDHVISSSASSSSRPLGGSRITTPASRSTSRTISGTYGT